MLWISYHWKLILAVVSSFMHKMFWNFNTLRNKILRECILRRFENSFYFFKITRFKNWNLPPLIRNLAQNYPKFTHESHFFFWRNKINSQNVSKYTSVQFYFKAYIEISKPIHLSLVLLQLCGVKMEMVLETKPLPESNSLPKIPPNQSP